MSSVFLSLSLFWSQHLSVNLELTVLSSLACLGSVFLLPPVLEMKHMLLDLASTWALGIQTLSPMLSQQSIYPQSRLPSPVFTTYDVIRESPGMGTLGTWKSYISSATLIQQWQIKADTCRACIIGKNQTVHKIAYIWSEDFKYQL